MQTVFERIEDRYFKACCGRGMTGSEINRFFDAFHEALDLAKEDCALEDTYEIVAVWKDGAKMGSAQADFACSPMLDRDAFLDVLAQAAQEGFDAQAEDSLLDSWDWGDFIDALYEEDGSGPIASKLEEFGIEPILEPDYLPARRILTVDLLDCLAHRG